MPCQGVFSVCLAAVVSDRRSQQAVCSRVAKILRQEREKRGLSMNRVAQRAGVSQQAVSYIERGKRSPTLETLLRIAAAIDIDFVEVIQKASAKPR
jgi:transcriptional regulator with XRE-family HTH domain